MPPENDDNSEPDGCNGATDQKMHGVKDRELPANDGGNGAASCDGGASRNEIPVIDLANPDESLLLEQLYEACSTWGFFQLINHGIPAELLSSFQRAMAAYFAMPYETKVRMKRNAKNARGYFDDELTKRKRDWKEALDVGVPGSRDWAVQDADDANACLDGHNQFPSGEECPNFREVVVEYFDECSKLSNRLAILMTLALSGGRNGEEEESFLERMVNEHTSYLRMNYYPPSDGAASSLDGDKGSMHRNSFSGRPAGEGTLGISPHRDAGFLTILLQDYECHSLQVARFEDEDHIGDDNDRWVTVHPVPGSLTINTGDMAMICSNGRFRAPLHRVLTDPAKKRYSAPYFYNPGYNELIAPFACCCSDDSKGNGSKEEVTNGADIQSLKYHPCLWGYFRALRFAGDLTDLGVEIQTSHFKVGSDSNHIAKQKRFIDAVDFAEPFNVDKYRHILE